MYEYIFGAEFVCVCGGGKQDGGTVRLSDGMHVKCRKKHQAKARPTISLPGWRPRGDRNQLQSKRTAWHGHEMRIE